MSVTRKRNYVRPWSDRMVRPSRLTVTTIHKIRRCKPNGKSYRVVLTIGGVKVSDRTFLDRNRAENRALALLHRHSPREGIEMFFDLIHY